MDDQAHQCPKCNGQMERGFLATQVGGGHALGDWVAGDVDRSLWTGIKVKGKTHYRVSTSYRCARCGYLELYAEAEAETLLRPAEGAGSAREDDLLRASGPEQGQDLAERRAPGGEEGYE